MANIEASKMDLYVDGKLVKKGATDNKQSPINFYWWKASDALMASQILNTVTFLKQHQGNRLSELVNATRLYGNSSNQISGSTFGHGSQSSPSHRISFNLCGSVIDTLVAKIAKNKVIPVFITNGGDWEIQQKAEQLGKFVEGCFYQAESHREGVYRFRDGSVWGTGVTYNFERRDKICEERTLPHEIIVDMVETLVGPPRQLHREKTVDRGLLLAEFADDPAAVEAITMASGATYEELGVMGTAADLVTVIESWHLRSNVDADENEENFDGVHAISIGDKLIYKDVYKKDWFPFNFIHYNKRLLGFWGQGACERLQNLQGEVNRLMILIQRSMWMGGSFKILVKIGSKVVSQALNNDVGTIVYWTGDVPPAYVCPPIIQQDIYAYIDSLIAKGYQQEGVSQLSASSMKPMGLNSGKSLRVYNDIEADRQLFISQEMERYYLEQARQKIETAKDIYSRKKHYEVMFPSEKFVETIDWADIKLREDQYVMKAYPMSSLADDLPGRLADITELMQAGMISPRAGRRLLRRPDVEMADALANAPEDLLHKIFEQMLAGKEYVAPEPHMDFQLAKQLGLLYLNYAQFHNCPEERMNSVRRFMTQMDDAMGLTSTAPPAGAPKPSAQPTPPSPPQAVPIAPPTSELLPNIPQAKAA